MKITIDRRELADALKWVTSALERRPSTPAMGGVRVVVDDSTLTLTAWNFISAHTAALPALGAEPGEALIPGAALSSLVGSMRGKEVTLAAAGAACEVNSGAARYSLRVLTLHDFTAPPKLPTTQGVTSGAALADAASAVARFAAKDAILPILTALHIEATKDSLTLAATDKFSIGCDEISYSGEPFIANLSAELITAATTGLADAGDVQIGVTDSMVSFTGDDRAVSIRKHDGEFPPAWRRLLDTRGDGVADIDVDDLRAAMRRCASLIEDRQPIAFNFTPTSLDLSIIGERGEGVDSVEATSTAESEAWFSPTIMGNALASFHGAASLTFNPADNQKPVILTGVAHPNRVAAVMPRHAPKAAA